MGHGNAPGQSRGEPRDGQVAQTRAHLGEDVVVHAARLNHVRIRFEPCQQRLATRRESELVVRFRRPFDALTRLDGRVHATLLLHLRRRIKGFVRDRVPSFVRAKVDIARVLQPRPKVLHGRLMHCLRRAQEARRRNIGRLQQRLEAHTDPVAQRPRIEVHRFRHPLDLESMLVRAGGHERLRRMSGCGCVRRPSAAAQLCIPPKHVGHHTRVQMPNVRLGIHIVDRRRHIVRLRPTRQRRPHESGVLIYIDSASSRAALCLRDRGDGGAANGPQAW